MELKNATARALLSTLPSADISLATPEAPINADLFYFDKQWSDFRIILFDADGETTSFVDMEIELFGYIYNTQKPTLIYKAEVSSDRGMISVPVENIIQYDYIIARQSADKNAIGATGAGKTAGKYQFAYNDKKAGN